MSAKLKKCEMFLLCKREATTSVKHPILGKVPCCKKCADWYRRMK